MKHIRITVRFAQTTEYDLSVDFISYFFPIFDANEAAAVTAAAISNDDNAQQERYAFVVRV